MIPHEEMYGEHFDIPQPDEQVFISWFEGGEVFRSGCCWHRGKGKVFYFRPGHEAFPIYYQPEIQQVIVNAVKWATPIDFPPVTYGNPPAHYGSTQQAGAQHTGTASTEIRTR